MRDGNWTTHCEGTAVVRTSPEQNGLATQTSTSHPHKLARNNTRTTKLDKITHKDSDPYQLHPLTIYRCLQHALTSAASFKHHCDSSPDSTVGLKVPEIEEFRVWSSEEETSAGHWKVHAVTREVEPKQQVLACVDVDLVDKTEAAACTLRGLQVMMCEDEQQEAFDDHPPPREPNARVPAFLRPLLK